MHREALTKERPFLILLALLLLSTSSHAAMQVRIKDIARIAGLESIELIGYGIVVGLNGSGDKDITLTKQTMANLFENFKISIPVNDIKSKNVAAVIITAHAQPFHKEGDRVDVLVSSVGDASSLEGGILLMTPLLNPNGELYALAQGSLTVGGFSAGSGGEGGDTVTRNHTTTAMAPGAGILKHSQSIAFCKNGIMRLLLRHPDFTTAHRTASAINRALGGVAVAQDASCIAIRVPQERLSLGQTASFVARLETVSVTPDTRARIIVNERTGTIVMGGAVHIGEAVVAHGNLTVAIKSYLHPSQPIAPFTSKSRARTVITEDVSLTVSEENARIMLVPETTTVRELADTLNLMGATPRDLISILEALHRLGAIQMELVAM